MKPILRSAIFASALALAPFGVALAQDADAPPPPDDTEWSAPDPDAIADASPMGGPDRTGWGHMGAMGMHRGGSMGMMPGGGLLRPNGRLAEALDLTDVQQDKLQVLGDDLARKQIRMRADLAIARLDLAKVMRADAPTQSEVDAKVNAVTRLQGDMMKAGLTATLEARKVLTAEQRKKLEDLKSERMGGGGRGDGRGRGSRG
ncbi:MAG: Spy/CpxP family protein refolding chaperone [Candidatus Eiseniibacteriota bacterium]